MIKRRNNNRSASTCHVFIYFVIVQVFGIRSIHALVGRSDNNDLATGVLSLDTNAFTTLAASTSNGDAACPHCNILSEMPMELADQINQVEDPDLFLRDFVDDKTLLSNISHIEQHPASRKRRAARETLRQATCQPVDTIVSLVPPDEKDPTVFYFPSCILVKQCGGCCAHTGTTCSPTDESDKQVSIKKTKFTGGTKLQAMGEVTVNVKEHKKCRCQCKKNASDCNSLQKFIANQCRCECLNIADSEECGKNPMKLWDAKTCGCVCRDEKECPSDLQFDQETCSCQSITDDEFLDFGDHTFNETYEATDVTKYALQSPAAVE